MFCVHIINISSLQLSANTIHLATGHLVRHTAQSTPSIFFFLVGITVWPHRFLMYLTKESSCLEVSIPLESLFKELHFGTKIKLMGCVDSLLLEQHRSEQEYWHKVLTLVVSVICFLASRGLPFRGENQIIGSAKNGNYLGILELLSEFDTFLEEHLKLMEIVEKETSHIYLQTFVRNLLN